MIESFLCHHCGESHPISELRDFEGELYCPDCLDLLTVICDCCGQRFSRNNVSQECDLTLCPSCRNSYAYCSQCGRLVPEDDLHYLPGGDDDGYCDTCYEEVHHVHNGIENYYYKPVPIFYGEGSRYLGMELEIDEGGESDSKANQIMSIANRRHEYLYIKHDGSLDNGMELVSHPMTLDYHLTEMPWAEIVSEAVSLGYRSHKSCTCGLHIHVNRSSFGNTQYEQEEVIARILFLVENYWNELLRFSRRTRDQMEQWASR